MAKQKEIDDVDYGQEIEQFPQDYSEQAPEIDHQNSSRRGKSPFQNIESEESENIGRADRASKGFSIAGAVSAQRKDK